MNQRHEFRRQPAYRLIALAVLPVILAFSASCRKGARVVRGTEANVLLITLDTTRADRLGCYGYAQARTPNLDRLAAEGVRYENAISPVPLTLPAHASILTGALPPAHQVRNNGNYFLSAESLTLAEIFKSKGYATAAFVASFVVDSRFGLDQGFDVYDDRIGDPAVVKGVYTERRADEVYRAFSAWFSGRPPGKFFAWVHFFDPHMPYDPPEPLKGTPGLDPYDGEIANVDIYIGKMIEELEREPSVRADTLIAVAGDHGEAFGEHGEFGHGVFCYQEALAVPFIIAAPGRLPAPSVIPDRVSLVDLLPTLLDFCGIESPPSAQGHSLLPLFGKRDGRDRSLYFETYFPFENMGCAPITGRIEGNRKYIELPQAELYDLDKDPGETNNLATEETRVAREMRDALLAWKKDIGREARGSARAVTPEERRRLESLGYLSMGRPAADKGSLPDPKDRIAGWTAFNRGMSLFQMGRLNEAETALREAMALAPDLTGPVLELGEIYFARRKAAPLISLFEDALALHPRSGELRIRFAHYLVLMGKIPEALERLKEAEPVVSFGQQEQFYDTMGMAYGTAGDFVRAAEAYEKVLDIEPENADAARKRGYALFRMGRMDESLASFRRAESLMPDNPLLLEEMGRFYAAQKDFDRAESYFRKAVERPDPPALALFNYAVLLSEKGDFSRAITVMERFLALPGQDVRGIEKGRQLIAVWRSL